MRELPFRAGTLLPRVTLSRTDDGETTTLREGRGPRVVVLLHAPDCDACRAYRRSLASVAPEAATWDGSILFVEGDHGGTGRPLREEETALLYRDVEGRLAPFAPAVIVADEWGEVYEAVPAGAGHAWPSPDEILEWVRFIAIQCPECEAPERAWLRGAREGGHSTGEEPG